MVISTNKLRRPALALIVLAAVAAGPRTAGAFPSGPVRGLAAYPSDPVRGLAAYPSGPIRSPTGLSAATLDRGPALVTGRLPSTATGAVR